MKKIILKCKMPKDFYKGKKEWTTNKHDWVGRRDEFGTYFEECVICLIRHAK